VSNRRDVDTFEFTPPDLDRVTGYLEHLSEAGQGWINLLPGVESNKQPPVTMGTLMPPRPARRSVDGITVGLLHPTGSKAVARLAEAGVALPPGWLVRQDHARRGLVVLARLGAPEAEVVGWAVQAGTTLCREPMTGEWQAVVYLP
jgi:DNA-binding transcriptional LysR family regulator